MLSVNWELNTGGDIDKAKIVLIGVNDSGKQYSPRIFLRESNS